MEPREDNRWALSEEAYQELKEAHAAVVDEFLNPETKLPNVVGMGIGIKLVGGNPDRGTIGEPTGGPALIVFVTRKLPREALAENDRIPEDLAGKQTDVVQTGRPMIDGTARFRPVKGGCSVSDRYSGGVGTIATGAWAKAGALATGTGGVGKPLILSCNHVLANTNQNKPGADILQPGIGDGGIWPSDVIARLWKFEPLDLFPPLPLTQHFNYIDAAVADTVQFSSLERQIHWIGYVRGYTSVSPSLMGRQVKKTGRTTGFTLGTITSLNATIDVGSYPGGATARFSQVILTTWMSNPGDSGALLTTTDNVAVGLGFASGAPSVSLHNPIELVQSILGVQVAETLVP